MDNVKIGAFIAEQRKKNNLTQKQLAELINVTDKAISRWETGKGMPEVSMLQPLACALGISVTELLKGERINNENIIAASDEIVVENMKQVKTNTTLLFIVSTIVFTLVVFIFLILIKLIESRLEIMQSVTFDSKFTFYDVALSGIMYIILGALASALSNSKERTNKKRKIEFAFIVIPALLMLFSWIISFALYTFTSVQDVNIIYFILANSKYLMIGGGIILGAMLFKRIREIIRERKK